MEWHERRKGDAMKIKTLERFHAYSPDDEPATHEIPMDEGEYCYARQALAAIAQANAEIERLRSEIAYLAYFHREADFGPAHTDVVMAIQAQYAEVHGAPVPEYWRYE